MGCCEYISFKIKACLHKEKFVLFENKFQTCIKKNARPVLPAFFLPPATISLLSLCLGHFSLTFPYIHSGSKLTVAGGRNTDRQSWPRGQEP